MTVSVEFTNENDRLFSKGCVKLISLCTSLPFWWPAASSQSIRSWRGPARPRRNTRSCRSCRWWKTTASNGTLWGTAKGRSSSLGLDLKKSQFVKMTLPQLTGNPSLEFFRPTHLYTFIALTLKIENGVGFTEQSSFRNRSVSFWYKHSFYSGFDN